MTHWDQVTDLSAEIPMELFKKKMIIHVITMDQSVNENLACMSLNCQIGKEALQEAVDE